jgi:hypothetical protein
MVLGASALSSAPLIAPFIALATPVVSMIGPSATAAPTIDAP